MERCLSLDDLTHLVGPLTEASVLRALHGRFLAERWQTKAGPVVICVNPFLRSPGPVVLCDDCALSPRHELAMLVREALSEYADTRQSQVILASGESASGKSYCTLRVLHELFTMAGGGTETDTFKHLSAALTVLHGLTSASTVSTPDSTRVGFFVENFMSRGAIYKTHIQCYFVEQTRTTHVPVQEKNYHIFYQMLAGLTPDEKVKFHLAGYKLSDLHYLSHGPGDQTIASDKLRFQCWKMSLGMLGISFSDVIRLLAGVLLLGNVEFIQNGGQEPEVKSHREFQAVAALLGIPGVVLYRGLTTKTRTIRGQICKSRANAATANCVKDLLAQALYFRGVACLVRKANTRSYATSESGQSTDSSDSHLPDLSSLSLGSSEVFCKSASGGFIGVLDMFGFESVQVNQLDQLCINLCAEKLQNVYNTFMFKAPMEACLEEGVRLNVDVIYRDNSALIELIASQSTGILSILDVEGRYAHISPEALVNRVKVQHRNNDRLFQPANKSQMFGICHFGDKVVYDARCLLHNNRDYLPDDIVCLFDQYNCNFGFAAHLFAKELSLLHGPTGAVYRISPGLGSNRERPDFPGTPAMDFCYRMNQLLEVLYYTKPHFIRCIKSNDRKEMNLFDSCSVLRQIKSLEVLETVKLMAGGLPHRLGYRQFNSRYRLFRGGHPQGSLGSPLSECKLILKSFLEEVDRSKLPYISVQWALGKKHVFFSEGCRQQLGAVRAEKLHCSAMLIQAVWRGYSFRSKNQAMCKFPLKSGREDNKSTGIHENLDSYSFMDLPGQHREFPSYIQDTCQQLGLQMDVAPPVPNRRNYTVCGDMKVYYPQIRVLSQSYQDPVSGQVFQQGQEVEVMGEADRFGYLRVNHHSSQVHLPYHLLEIRDQPSTFHLDV
ncbi:unconventional myosin-IXb-like [Liolophura sinensis]|uniref:unconventional myosin-IXb-like n=1 Tax=Liolophura sinensis TaxID=3198878 RepID=UPI0031595351